MSTADAHALRINDVPLFREYVAKVWGAPRSSSLARPISSTRS